MFSSASPRFTLYKNSHSECNCSECSALLEQLGVVTGCHFNCQILRAPEPADFHVTKNISSTSETHLIHPSIPIIFTPECLWTMTSLLKELYFHHYFCCFTHHVFLLKHKRQEEDQSCIEANIKQVIINTYTVLEENDGVCVHFSFSIS